MCQTWGFDKGITFKDWRTHTDLSPNAKWKLCKQSVSRLVAGEKAKCCLMLNIFFIRLRSFDIFCQRQKKYFWFSSCPCSAATHSVILCSWAFSLSWWENILSCFIKNILQCQKRNNSSLQFISLKYTPHHTTSSSKSLIWSKANQWKIMQLYIDTKIHRKSKSFIFFFMFYVFLENQKIYDYTSPCLMTSGHLNSLLLLLMSFY